MNYVDISSVENQAVKFAVKLKNSARERRDNGLFVAEGLRLCSDASKHGIAADTVFFTNRFENEHGKILGSICSGCGKNYRVTESVMKKLCDTVNPQGVLTLFEKPQWQKISVTNGLYVALQNIADPSNLGAVARSAEAFGAKGLLLSDGCCDPYSPKSLRAGMGALLRLPVFETSNFVDTLMQLRCGGMELYAAVVNRKADDIRSVKAASGSVLLIGNEANGLTDDVIDVCSHRVTIPMAGRAESLNASVAAAVLIWEMLKGCAEKL